MGWGGLPNMDTQLPLKHWTSYGRPDQVHIASVRPRPIMDLFSTSKIGPVFGRLIMTEFRRLYEVGHLDV